MAKLRTICGEGTSVVVGLPRGFDLTDVLQSAKEIRVATAFAHTSGWRSLKPGIAAGSGNVFLLTGLEYNQTEPDLLKDWLQLKLRRSDKVNVSLAASKPFFHPKVLIVRTANTQFAVVGSGNMSRGGFHSNCECGVYLSNAATVNKLREWFDAQFNAGIPLNSRMIQVYRPKYMKAKKQTDALRRQQSDAESEIAETGKASLAHWNFALKTAETFYRAKAFKADYAKRKRAVRRMLQYLNPPTFKLGEHEWFMFYQQTVLGALDSRSRDKVFSQEKRLQGALRALSENPERAVSDVLGRNGKLRIKGFGVNTVSKILAAELPNEWPVYNARVAKVLAEFGYTPPRGAGLDGRYIAYRYTMKKFMAACKERGLSHVDAISLDAFFYARSEELKR